MRRSERCQRAPWLALACSLLVCGCRPAQPDDDALGRGSNIVVIVIDTLRADRLPMYGHAVNTAPFLAELAQESAVFERAWTTSSWTAPSTASLFTSTHPNEHDVRYGMAFYEARKGAIELKAIDGTLETLPVFLRSQGYRTYGVSDNLNIGERLRFADGFDEFAHLAADLQPHWAVAVNERIEQWAPELANGDPFFLYVHYMDPHRPYRRHEQWIEPGTPTPANPMDDVAAYDSEIRYVDEAIRRVFELLPLEDNCWVFVLADHGEEFRDHGGNGHFLLYSEITHIPLIVHSSDHPELAGRYSGDASILDLLPTLRELVGAEPSPQDRGRSLLPVLRGAEPEQRPHFAMRSFMPPLRHRSIVLADHKLIVREPDDTVELFDLSSDPDEQRNIASAKPDVVRALRSALEDQERAAALDPTAPGTRFEPTDEEKDALRALGYTGDG